MLVGEVGVDASDAIRIVGIEAGVGEDGQDRNLITTQQRLRLLQQGHTGCRIRHASGPFEERIIAGVLPSRPVVAAVREEAVEERSGVLVVPHP